MMIMTMMIKQIMIMIINRDKLYDPSLSTVWRADWGWWQLMRWLLYWLLMQQQWLFWAGGIKTHLNCCRIFICYSARWVPPLYLISYLSYHVIFESQRSISFPLIDNGSLSKYLLHGISVDPSEHNDGRHDDGGNQIPHNLRCSSLGWIPLISISPIDRRPPPPRIYSQ